MGGREAARWVAGITGRPGINNVSDSVGSVHGVGRYLLIFR